MPSVLSLPIELIDKFLTIATRSEDNENSYPIPQFVSSCGLVCKTFYRVARTLQFNVVERVLTDEDAQIFPEVLEYQHKDLSLPPLVHYVRELHLIFDTACYALDKGYLNDLDAFLAPFSGDACRIRSFTFSTGTYRGKPGKRQFIHTTPLSWHTVLPSTHRTFSNILRSSSLETVDIHGVRNLPFSLLQSITPNAKKLSLASTLVKIKPDDLDQFTAQISPPLLAPKELYIGGLRFRLDKPPVTGPTKTNKPSHTNVAFDLALSRLIDLSKLDALVLVHGYQDDTIQDPFPPLEGVFARCRNLRAFKVEFDKCRELYPLHLDKLPSSVARIELYGLTPLFWAPHLDGSANHQARFANADRGELALFPTGIASATSRNPQRPEVTIYLPLFVYQVISSQIETLVSEDGSTSYWDALLENLMTISASQISLNIRIALSVPGLFVPVDLRPRPDEKIDAEVHRVFDDYNAKHPDRPITVQYSCSIQGS